ncbi:N-glycosylase/DNA lyase-like isoform X2 [Gordionus sp. m RMFG-2023]|uniref:N-glycosylase/DNA lyase-like isoform X2 n=1 Tax=Gordionus sp. m RMFG-2023 TaxID=3053472 RepID=UPI0031FE4049
MHNFIKHNIPLQFNDHILNLSISLFNGQSFRWRKLDSLDNKYLETFTGVIEHDIWIISRVNENDINCVIYTQDKEKMKEEFVKKFHDYFSLDIDIEQHILSWIAKDDHIKPMIQRYKGLRILRQNIIENIFSFICSSNNNVARIRKMVESLCIHFGEKLGDLENQTYYSFPTLDRLSREDVHSNLARLGFGYRAKYVHEAAKFIENKQMQWAETRKSDMGTGMEHYHWLENLRHMATYETAHKELMLIPGIGPKVADCICLMSLNKTRAVPIDTHILQIVKKSYSEHISDLTYKSLSKKRYREIGYGTLGNIIKDLETEGLWTSAI